MSGAKEDATMRKYHVVSAKRMGWDNSDKTYESFFFPIDKFSKDDALAQFRQVRKETLKNNNWYPIQRTSMMAKRFILLNIVESLMKVSFNSVSC